MRRVEASRYPRAKSNEAAHGSARGGPKARPQQQREIMDAAHVCQTYRHRRMQAYGPASQFDWAGRVKMGSVDTRGSPSLAGQHR